MISRLPPYYLKNGRKSAVFGMGSRHAIAAIQSLCEVPGVGDVHLALMLPTNHFRTPSPDGRQSFSTCRSSTFGHRPSLATVTKIGGKWRVVGKGPRARRRDCRQVFFMARQCAHSANLSKEVFRWRAEKSVLPQRSCWALRLVVTRWVNRPLSVVPSVPVPRLCLKATSSQVPPLVRQATFFIASVSPSAADQNSSGAARLRADRGVTSPGASDRNLKIEKQHGTPVQRITLARPVRLEQT